MLQAIEQSTSAEMVRNSDHDRWLCALFVGADKREAVFSLLAFNSEIAKIRETVSEPILGDIRLKWWDEALDKIYNGEMPAHPVAISLAPVINAYDLRRELFKEVLLGRTQDLSEEPPATYNNLQKYADQTGGALQILLSSVNGGDEIKSRELGTCWALLGMIRAIPFHFQNGMVLVPQEMLARYHLTQHNFVLPENNAGLTELVKELAESVEERIQNLSEIKTFHYSEKALLVLAHMYLNELKMRNYDLHGGEWAIPSWKRSLRLWAGSFVGR